MARFCVNVLLGLLAMVFRVQVLLIKQENTNFLDIRRREQT